MTVVFAVRLATYIFDIISNLQLNCCIFFKKWWIYKMTPKNTRSSKYTHDGCHRKENLSLYVPSFDAQNIGKITM